MKSIKILTILLISLNLNAQREFIIGFFHEKTELPQETSIKRTIAANYKECNINFLVGQSMYYYLNSGVDDNILEYKFMKDNVHVPISYSPKYFITNKYFSHETTVYNNLYQDSTKQLLLERYNSQMSNYSKYYNLGDEPITQSSIDYIINTNSILKNLDSSNKSFVNLLSIIHDSFNLNSSRSIQKYLSYLNKFKNKSIDYIAFDYYTNSWGINNNYYASLACMQSVFGNNFLSYVGIDTLFKTRNPDTVELYQPTINEYRHAIFNSLSYGAKGLIYFYILPNQGVALYDEIKKNNIYLKDIVGPIVANSTKCITLHKSYTSSINGDLNKTISSYNQNNTDFIVNDVNYADILIGQFDANDNLNVDKNFLENDNKYLLVTNKSSTATLYNVILTLKGNQVNKTYLAPKINDYNPSSSNSKNYSKLTSYYNSTYNSSTVSIGDLLPGEGVFVKIVPKVIPCPADYDGDGYTDLAVKSNTGQWRINFSNNGYESGWDTAYNGYGDENAIPVPADYDGDGKADLSVKTNFNYYKPDGSYDYTGAWLINRSNNTFVTGWDESYTGYGGADAIPVPADYDGDGKADLSVKTNINYYKPDGSYDFTGAWLINNSLNRSFNMGWNQSMIYTGYGGADAIPVPADYDGDGKADLSVKTNWGAWYVNGSSPNRSFQNGWNIIPNPNFNDNNFIPLPAKYKGTTNNVKYCTFSKENIWTIYDNNTLIYQNKIAFKNPFITETNINLNSEITIYPNPTSGVLNFSNLDNDKEVNIISMQGVLLRSFKSKYKIDISDLNEGSYIIRIDEKNYKIVLQK